MAEIAKSADQILEELFQSLGAGSVELPLDICGVSKLQENGDEPNSTEAVPDTVGNPIYYYSHLSVIMVQGISLQFTNLTVTEKPEVKLQICKNCGHVPLSWVCP